jgi:hypothetical protein
MDHEEPFGINTDQFSIGLGSSPLGFSRGAFFSRTRKYLTEAEVERSRHSRHPGVSGSPREQTFGQCPRRRAQKKTVVVLIYMCHARALLSLALP